MMITQYMACWRTNNSNNSDIPGVVCTLYGLAIPPIYYAVTKSLDVPPIIIAMGAAVICLGYGVITYAIICRDDSGPSASSATTINITVDPTGHTSDPDQQST
jgi:hypothetical protein